MADTQPNTGTPAPDDAPEGDDETRRPYVVVLMSAEMKAAVQAWAKANDTNPTALGRKLLAEAVGYDLSGEPEPTRRSVYTSDEERADAKKVASKRSGLLRKALFQVHMAQLKKKPELLRIANAFVLWHEENKKPSLAALEEQEKLIDDAIKAGK
jgi:hypothetical protein